MKQQFSLFDLLLLIVGSACAWWILARIVGPDAISGPIETLQRLDQMLHTATFWKNARATGVAFAWACLLSLAGGLVIGLALGTSRMASDVSEPLLGAVYSVPKVALYPVVLLVFGLTLSAKVAFGVLHGIFPVILLTIGAVRNMRRVHLKTARVLNLSRAETARRIILPAILPEVMTGLRIGFSSALLGTLVAELFASEEGLGVLLIRAMEANRTVDIMAIAFLLFSVAAIAGLALLTVEQRFRRL